MFTFKKQFILQLALSIIIVSALIYIFSRNYSTNEQRNYISPVPAVAGQINNQENLIKALENAKSEEERKKILEENRDVVTPDFIIAMLWKAREISDDEKNFFTDKRNLVQIAIQASEFTGDKISLAKSLLCNSTFEQKDPNCPSVQKALKLFLETGDRKGEACCYIREASRLHYISGKTDEALTILDKALSIFKETGDELRAGDCYFVNGEIYRATGDKDKAVENFKQAILIYEKEGDIIHLLKCYKLMAFIYQYQYSGFLEEARNYLEITRKLIEDLDPAKIKDLSRKEEGYNFRDSKFEGKDKLMADCYLNLANLYSRMGKDEEAIKSYKEAIKIGEFTWDKIRLASVLRDYAWCESKKEKNPEPESLKKALSIYIEKGDRKNEAECYGKQAILLEKFNKKSEAMEYLDKAITIYYEISEKNEEARLYSIKASFCTDMDQAIESQKKSIELYKGLGNNEDLINAYNALSSIYRYYGFLEKSREYIEIQKELIEKSAPEKKENLIIKYYYSLAHLAITSGRYEEAIKNYGKVIELAEKSNNTFCSNHGCLACIGLGNIYFSWHKDRALKYYLKALNWQSTDDILNILNVNSTYDLVGDYYLSINQPDEAIKYYEAAMKKSEKINIPFPYICVFEEKELRRANHIRHLITAYVAKGDFKMASKLIEEYLEICKKSGEKLILSFAYEDYSYYCLENGNRNKAQEYINKAFELADHSASLPGAEAYMRLGRFYFKINELDKALKNYRKAIKIIEDLNITFPHWNFYFSTGLVYEKQGNLQEAYKYYYKSIKIIENMRQEFKVEDLKRDFMQDKIKVYEHMIDLLIKMKKDKDAFDYNEKARARAFLDILANQKVDIHHGISPELAAKEEELTTRIQYLSGYVRQEKEKPIVIQRSAFIEENNKSLKGLKLEYEQVLEQIKMECPEYLSFITINPLTIKEIQSLLDKDTVIVEYFLGENKGYAWIIGNNSFNTVIIDCPEKNIESLVREYRDCACDNITAEKIKSDKWRDTAKKLYTILFKNSEKYIINKRRILISPHKILHYLPFQVLTDDKDKMLVEKYDITYLPSASVLKYCQNKNTLKKDSLLAFELGNFKVGELSSLPGTIEEVNSISPYFLQKEVYSGKNMCADILYKKGGEFDILHLATHGIMDTGAPLFSSLVFADRRLNVYEIFDLNLKAYLVTLSACKTGIGEEANGDELVGLSRAFIYAGTPTICSSLWDVSDVSTSELMERFYFYLKNTNKAEALRLAQIELMKKYPHPFFWAPFVLTGDWK
jgi:CHAT domain-containing protein/tetratricopeptide (TPR) repeat protein